jgi:lipopolysaccharide/colanic/teichoic acid biosynthesis glycosyltransferase
MNRAHIFACDLTLVAFATLMALILRDNFETSVEHLEALAPYLIVSLLVAGVIFPTFGAYRALWRFASLGDVLLVVSAALATIFGAVAVGFSFNRLNGVPRSLPILQALLVVALLGGARLLAMLASQERRWSAVPDDRPSANAPRPKTTLVVGLGRLTDLYLRCVAELAANRVRVAGILTENERQIGCSVHGVPVLGGPEAIAETIRTLDVHGVAVDSVVVTREFEALSPAAREALAALERDGRTRVEFLVERMGLALYSDADEEVAPHSADRGAAALSMSEAELERLVRRPIWRVKRAIDIVLAAIMLTICAPLMILVSIGVALDVGLPVTFWQQRPGLRGRGFKLRKFRTMRAPFDPAGRRIADEARLSSLGLFLRRARLDELPQLLNILRGEMSFVGPRPLLPKDQPTDLSGRLLVRPGLTGWAQVKGGREISIADKTALDLWYVRNASLSLDALVLLHTAAIVLFGERIDQAAIRRAWRDLGVSTESRAATPPRPNGSPAATENGAGGDAEAPRSDFARRENAA